MSRSAVTAPPRLLASAFQFSNATSYGRRSSVIPSNCVASTSRPCASTQPRNPDALLAVSVAIRHARTVSGRAPVHRALSASNTLLSCTTNRLSASIVTWMLRGARAIGSNTGSVTRAPFFGRSPSATASGTRVGSSTGPLRRTWCVSTWVGELRTATTSTESPFTWPVASIGVSPASTCILKRLTRSARVSSTSVRAVVRCSSPAIGRSATR